MTVELIRLRYRLRKIMVIPTTILAPEEIPNTKGPAMGLRKKVWSRNPETESAPPRMAASSIRGIRMLKMILLSVEPSSTAWSASA